MIDEKEVLKALVCRANDPVVNCAGCPYRDRECEFICDFQRICRDALALLGAQKPRVLTLEEAEGRIGDYIHIEVRGRNIGEYRMLGELDSYSRKYRYLYVLHPGETHCTVYSYNFINKTWRPWSARPTEEQMRETPWEGDKNAEHI